MDSSTIFEPKYASPKSANPLSAQVVAVRPRQPKRQRPNSSTAKTTHARHDNTVLWTRCCANKLSTNTKPLNSASVSTAKPAVSAWNVPASSASTEGSVVNQPSAL